MFFSFATLFKSSSSTTSRALLVVDEDNIGKFRLERVEVGESELDSSNQKRHILNLTDRLALPLLNRTNSTDYTSGQL